MILGKRWEDRATHGWWFAWRPVFLNDGRMAWLERVWWEENPGPYLLLIPSFYRYHARPEDAFTPRQTGV